MYFRHYIANIKRFKDRSTLFNFIITDNFIYGSKLYSNFTLQSWIAFVLIPIDYETPNSRGKEELVMINPKNIEKSPNHRNTDKNVKILSKALMANEEC
jgi:hypothetical protein